MSIGAMNIAGDKALAMRDPHTLLSECCDSGRPIMVELPDHRLVAIQSIEPDDSDDSLINDLLESNASFRALVEESQASPRREFTSRNGG